MSISKNDLRYTKTDEIIQNVFYNLLNKIGFRKITVKMIIEEANINRSTFYDHYLDKYDLLEKEEQKLIDGFRKSVSSVVNFSNIRKDTLHKEMNKYIETALTYILVNNRLFSIFVEIHDATDFFDLLNPVAFEILENFTIIEHVNVPSKYVFAAISGAVKAVIKEWLLNDCKETIPEMQAYFITMFSYTILT